MMLDFAEQTGSGIVIMVWSFLHVGGIDHYQIATCYCYLGNNTLLYNLQPRDENTYTHTYPSQYYYLEEIIGRDDTLILTFMDMGMVA